MKTNVMNLTAHVALLWCIVSLGVAGETAFVKDVAVSPVYPSGGVLGLCDGKGWTPAEFREGKETRENYLGRFYEEINLTADAETAPGVRDLLGFQCGRYYCIPGSSPDEWLLVDDRAERMMSINVFYSSQSALSRGLALDRFTMVLRNPTEHRGDYRVQQEERTWMVVSKKGQYPSCAEQDGYALAIQPCVGEISGDESRVVVHALLDGLTGKQKVRWFPTRARRLTQLNRMSYDEKMALKQRENDKMGARMPWIRMDESACELAKLLGVNPMFDQMQSLFDQKILFDVYPNINSGVGTLRWIRKNVKDTFTPQRKNDESHVNGLTGTFTVKREKEESEAVHYVIVHTGNRLDAMHSLFNMLSSYEHNLLDIKKKAEIIHVTPGLVGDYDLCLKPMVNSLGRPMKEVEHSWILFTRGNTAVMLASEDFQVSVLPLAKQIDEALKKNIEAYETPELVK